MIDKMHLNKNFELAKKNKNDEFYTKISDIENEIKHYRAHFKNKYVFLNCDDPEYSNFWKFFYLNFEFLGLKHLTATHYSDEKQTFRIDYYANDNGQMIFEHTDLEQNGDFRSPESIEILKKCDIVVTNPPFSLFRDYIQVLVEYDKDFLIIGNQNNITYKEVFPLIQANKVWLGINSGSMEFEVSDTEEYRKQSGFRVDDEGRAWRKFGNICWFTTLDYPERHEEMILYKQYNPEDYPTYDNYDAIEVSRVKDIPFDYIGAMGVPVSFLQQYNPEQFEILGMTDRKENSGLKTRVYTSEDSAKFSDLNRRSVIVLPDGSYQGKYARILIKNKTFKD